MSRIGKKPIEMSPNVDLKINGSLVVVKGPKGELSTTIHPLVDLKTEDGQFLVIIKKDSKLARSLWGTTRQLIQNMVIGVTTGFQKQLEVNGVGYRVALSGKKITLNVGFSHAVDYELPAGVEATVEKNIITLSGMDKQLVGEVAAQIRKIKKPEPYKGKGIKYVDEVIIRKAGKQAKASA